MNPDTLFEKLRSEIPQPEYQEKLSQAYQLVSSAHAERLRSSREPFVLHLIATARIVHQWGLGPQLTLMALLHDVLDPENKKKAVTGDMIEHTFGPDVALVVSAMAQLGYVREAYENSGSVYELSRILEVSRNLRVGLLKLASGLEMARNLSHIADKQRRRARAQFLLAAYGPVARRFGMWQVKREIDDACLDALLPEKTAAIRHWQYKFLQAHESELLDLAQEIRVECAAVDTAVEVLIEPRHIHSVVQRIHQSRPLFDPGDSFFKELRWSVHVAQLIVLSESTADCYRILGAVHSVLTPNVNSFRDYIARPKPNGYSSLHTQGLRGAGRGAFSVDARIRTQRMHEIANMGISDHAAFSTWLGISAPGTSVLTEKSLNELNGEQRCIDTLIKSLMAHDDEAEGIRVFTPQGREVILATDATPLDLAYAIHTELGHQYQSARVNGVEVPIDYRLQNNEVVEIIARPDSHPNPSWLQVVGTGRARKKIQEWLNRTPKLRGQRLLEDELLKLGIHLEDIDTEHNLQDLIASEFDSLDNLLEAIGTGRVDAVSISKKLFDRAPSPIASRYVILGPGVSERLGMKSRWIRMAKCCQPHFPDRITGTLGSSEIIVHKQSCGNSRAAQKHVEVLWRAEIGQPLTLRIDMESFDRPALIRDIATIVSGHSLAMADFQAQRLGSGRASIQFTLDLRDSAILDPLMSELRCIDGVTSVLARGENDEAVDAWLARTSHDLPRTDREVHQPSIGMPNPYSPGHPVATAAMFFGRDREINTVLGYITPLSRSTGIIITGSWRVGKTSLALEVARRYVVQRDYVPVFVDLQHYSANNDYQILRRVAREIQRKAAERHVVFKPLQSVRGDEDLYAEFQEHLVEAARKLEGKGILLMLDEFDATLLSYSRGFLSERFFSALRSWAQMQPLTILLLGTNRLHGRLSNMAPGGANVFVPMSLGPLDPDAARLLIQRPVERYLYYERDVVEDLLSLSAGYPYYLHVMCAKLFAETTGKRRTTVTGGDLKTVLEDLTRGSASEGYYAWFWEHQDSLQSVLLSALASVAEADSAYSVSSEQLMRALVTAGCNQRQARLLLSSAEHLVSLGTLKAEVHQGDMLYRIELPLFRMWVTQNWPLKHTLAKMEDR